jgi:heptosyltransferase-2
MNVRESKKIPFEDVKRILIRGTNWIGDVIMSLPAISAVRETLPHARISVLAKPWVTDIYRLSPDVDEVILFQSPGIHDGIRGKLRLASEIKNRNFDLALLLQNAIEAAIIAWLARIPVRAGYNSDGRGLLLTHSVQRTREIKTIHQVGYYLEMVKALGFHGGKRNITLRINDDLRTRSGELRKQYNVKDEGPLVGIAPGAQYGPAKMWYPQRFAAVADRLADEFLADVILFGSREDRERTTLVTEYARHNLINMAGETGLAEAISLIAGCDLFISNDSGLMHLAGALDIPLVAIFGSTNPLTTSPLGDKSVVVHRDVDCSPCLKKTCPTDFRCMDLIGIDDVYGEAKRLLEKGRVAKGQSG